MGLLSRKKATSTPPPSISGPMPTSNIPAVPTTTTDYSRKQPQSSSAAGVSSSASASYGREYGSNDKYSASREGSGLPSPPGSPVQAEYGSGYSKPPTPPHTASSYNSRPLQNQQQQSTQQQRGYTSNTGNTGSGYHTSAIGNDRISVDSVEMTDGTQSHHNQYAHSSQQTPQQRAAVGNGASTQQSSSGYGQQRSHQQQQQVPQLQRPVSTASNVLSPTPSQTSSTSRKTSSRYNLNDFTFIRTLGTGSFGRVHLVRSQHNSRSYAIKVLSKERVVKMKQVEHTNSEREMLERVRHPFLVNLWGTFKDSKNLYMVMDFVAGGELFSLLRKSQRFPDPVAKFFAAEVALALDYLHSLDIIYRDLKPENILLGADGHVKITDFGFAKHVPDITWTLCGTPDYLAPEIVQSRGYNKSVDWYALGVLMFEMLAGYPPFFTEDSNPMRLYEKIIAGKVRYPAYFAPEAKDLLKSLLTTDITKRYGNLANGSRDIFGHVWFQEVDWERLYRKEIPAPYVPKVEGDWDASNFDAYPEIDLSEYGNTIAPDPHGHLFPLF
ncbi:cAMP-dependent protein kinase catalytic subunit [Microbotryomycetes sp. JL221]|nr:cAMP-dependent protein kinase catalytic subunit [Microbotryomycetes sp. JL221]